MTDIMNLLRYISNRFYVGQEPHILVTDLDMLKQILVKDFNNFMDHAVSVLSLVMAIHDQAF